MGERRTYLLGGRRVALSDLLDEGLLSAGDALTFHRPRVGRTHTAVVEPRGTLLVQGRSYATPSAAARTAAGVAQMDGWAAWVTEDGRTLHQLRAELLDAIADDARSDDDRTVTHPVSNFPEVDAGDSEPEEPTEAMLPRHEFLREARRAAERGEPLGEPVRVFVSRWGGHARGHRISHRIRADLANYGLATRPDFMRVSLDDDIALVAVEAEDVTPTASTGSSPSPLQPRSEDRPVGDDDDVIEIGLTLGNLVSPDRKLVSVGPDATVAQA